MQMCKLRSAGRMRSRKYFTFIFNYPISPLTNSLMLDVFILAKLDILHFSSFYCLPLRDIFF